MGPGLLIVATLCYVGAAVDLWQKDRRLMAAVFVCYAVANALLTAIAYKER